MRIGLLGGTFDPVHNGHIALARAALEKLELDKVWLLPSGEPPYKKPYAGRADRLNMVRMAAAGADGIEVCDTEILRGGETYAVDTLRLLNARFPEHEFVYILGSDAASRVERWRGIEEVRKMCRFACVVRAGATEEVPEGMLRLDAGIEDISSAGIRESIAGGRIPYEVLPEKVAGYIERRGLYIAAMCEADIIADLKARLKKSRFEHTMGVADTAKELAEIYGVPAGKAYMAGLLHDCAKGTSGDELLSLAEISGADADEIAVMPVLHAPVGAYLAKERYGVRDSEVISAIRRHTVGAEDMSLLDAVVYVADMVEPGRRYFDGLDRAREMARRDIFRAALICGRLTSAFNDAKGARMHPVTKKMMEKIENGGMNNG